jgi:hypothetical protein
MNNILNPKLQGLAHHSASNYNIILPKELGSADQPWECKS